MNKLSLIAATIAVMLAFPPSTRAAGDSALVIIPADFSTIINNPLFKMPEGRTTYFRSQTADGLEKGEILVTGATRTLMGVKTLIVRDRVYLDGVILEDTMDYFAQHKNGAVWYFGEDVDNYEDGVLVDHDGTWHAGVDGARPGRLMLAHPKVGQVYREEYYAGQAEDMAKVLSITATIRTPLGTFNNCLKTENWSPLEPGVKEHKFYCRQVGGLVLEKDLQSGECNVLVKIKDCD